MNRRFSPDRMRQALRQASSVAAIGLLAATAACDPGSQVTVGTRAPSYAAPTLDGEEVSLSALRGEVVLLNVWATWCYPCRREMPSFEALHRDLGPEGLRVVAVSIDKHGARAEIEEFLEDHGISFTILFDPDQRVARTFNTMGVPETFLIDRDGVLVKHWIGRIDGYSGLVRGPIREALATRYAAGHAPTDGS
jgi:cytochrome c biogenesis protein CcmG, thiol:disulfide interchange protein DsbE